jgi:hypothetical protein
MPKQFTSLADETALMFLLSTLDVSDGTAGNSVEI